MSIAFSPGGSAAIFLTLAVASLSGGCDSSSGLQPKASGRTVVECNGRWVPLGPAPIISDIGGEGPHSLFSGRALSIAADPRDPDVIYLGASGGGVWKTVDGGRHWTGLTDDQPSLSIRALAVAPSNPDVVLAGTGETNPGTGRGILKSTDGGASWVSLAADVFYRHSIQKIAIDPRDADNLYVAIGEYPPITSGLQDSNRGIWRSQDGGASWRNTSPPELRDRNWSDLVLDSGAPDTVYGGLGEITGAAENGVYKTSDGGGTWTRSLAPQEAGAIYLGMSAASSAVVYAAIAGIPTIPNPLVIKKTRNAGRSWRDLSGFDVRGGAFTTTLAVDPTTPDVAYVASFKDGFGINGEILTEDGGRTWAEIGRGINNPRGDHRGVAFDAKNRLLDANDGGASRFDRSTRRWADLIGNLAITQFWDISLHPKNPLVAYGCGPDNGFEKLTPGSDGSWYQVHTNDGSSVLIDPISPSTVYAQTLGVSLERSDDRGWTWQRRTEGIDMSPGFVPVVIDPVRAGRLLLATQFVYETWDRADHWTRLGGFGQKIDRLGIVPGSAQMIYAAARGQVGVTVDHGQSWKLVDLPGLTDRDSLGAVSVSPREPRIAYAVRNAVGRSGGHVFLTTDAGESWTDISGNLPDLATYTIAVDSRGERDVLYVGTTQGVFVSYDEGENWKGYGRGLPNAVVEKLVLNTEANVLAAGTDGRGLFEICVASQ